MPFKSEKQRRYMHSQHPEIAERWEREATGKMSTGGANATTPYNSNPAPDYAIWQDPHREKERAKKDEEAISNRRMADNRRNVMKMGRYGNPPAAMRYPSPVVRVKKVDNAVRAPEGPKGNKMVGKMNELPTQIPTGDLVGKMIDELAGKVVSPTDMAGARKKTMPMKGAVVSPTDMAGYMGGEGSRGGHVIGHTASGKPIYSNSHKQANEGWSRQDHVDAFKAHNAAAVEFSEQGDDDMAQRHTDIAEHHFDRQAAQRDARRDKLGVSRSTLEKAGGMHKYISRKPDGKGGWLYTYGPEGDHGEGHEKVKPKLTKTTYQPMMRGSGGEADGKGEHREVHAIGDWGIQRSGGSTTYDLVHLPTGLKASGAGSKAEAEALAHHVHTTLGEKKLASPSQDEQREMGQAIRSFKFRGKDAIHEEDSVRMEREKSHSQKNFNTILLREGGGSHSKPNRVLDAVAEKHRERYGSYPEGYDQSKSLDALREKARDGIVKLTERLEARNAVRDAALKKQGKSAFRSHEHDSHIEEATQQLDRAKDRHRLGLSSDVHEHVSRGLEALDRHETAMGGGDVKKALIDSIEDGDDAFDLLMKGVARGGKYYRRTPKPGGGYNYYYSKEAYEREHQHASGQETARERMLKQFNERHAAGTSHEMDSDVLNEVAQHVYSQGDHDTLTKVRQAAVKRVKEGLGGGLDTLNIKRLHDKSKREQAQANEAVAQDDAKVEAKRHEKLLHQHLDNVEAALRIGDVGEAVEGLNAFSQDSKKGGVTANMRNRLKTLTRQWKKQLAELDEAADAVEADDERTAAEYQRFATPEEHEAEAKRLRQYTGMSAPAPQHAHYQNRIEYHLRRAKNLREGGTVKKSETNLYGQPVPTLREPEVVSFAPAPEMPDGTALMKSNAQRLGALYKSDEPVLLGDGNCPIHGSCVGVFGDTWQPATAGLCTCGNG